MKADVYRNLTRDCYSVRSRESEDYGRVRWWTKRTVLTDVEFVVQESGRQRVIEEERKNVHAFIRGTLSNHKKIPKNKKAVEVTYNPYKHSTFVDSAFKQPVRTAEVVVLMKEGVYAFNVT